MKPLLTFAGLIALLFFSFFFSVLFGFVVGGFLIALSFSFVPKSEGIGDRFIFWPLATYSFIVVVVLGIPLLLAYGEYNTIATATPYFLPDFDCKEWVQEGDFSLYDKRAEPACVELCKTKLREFVSYGCSETKEVVCFCK